MPQGCVWNIRYRRKDLDINDAFINSLTRWSEKDFDNRIEEAVDKFDGWIKDFDEEERTLLSELILKFSYYSQKNITDIVKQMCDLSIKKFGVSNADSVISVIRKQDGKFNSSYEYWMLHQLISGLSKKIYYDSLNNIDDENWKYIKNIVFVDDCSGTGEQFTKFLKQQKKDFSGKRIILLVVEIMEHAKNTICKYAKDNRINIEIIAYSVKEKAFESTDDVTKEKYAEMSNKHEIHNNYICGFKNAEALMAFYNNTPNDTLGLFWFSSSKNNPIFLRKMDEEPGWKKINKDQKERRKQQYGAKSR